MVRLACLAIIGAAVVTLGGCFESELFTCGPDRVCPVGYTCTASHTCLSPSEIAACEGVADGQPCTINMVVGTCREGGCLVAFCGNGVIDQGEVCDDGNELGGDGCNGTCTSDESCGNGIVELDEACDCGSEAHPGPGTCDGTFNGGTLCSDTCTLRHCGDGVLDPGEVCDDGNTTPGDGCNFACTSTEVCGNGIIDYFKGEECDGGPTCNGNCKLFRCGNSQIDPGEVCDDGNTTPGDGCNYDCTSDESCGNGIVDYFANEQCDDGGTASRDGCSQSCKGEQRGWTRTQPVTALSPSYACPMVYDVARDRTVALAGSRCQQTWELHGTTWTQRSLQRAPSGRMWAGLAYDSKRARVVLFGGDTSGAQLADTWEYDGVNWTSIEPPATPSARSRSAVGYDPKRGVVVLFGGNSGSGAIAETWEYNGVTWTQRTPATSPTARMGAVMAYDAKRGVMVMFGGWAGGVSPTYYDETWEYDGTTWTQATPTASPSGREAASMTFDTTLGQMVLFGGSTASGVDAQDTWEYDGTTWTNPTPTTPPSIRRDAALAYVMGARQRVMLYGGGHATAVYNDVYELVGNAWTPMPLPTSAPTARTESALAYDAKRGKVVLFGGSTGSAETWELDADGIWSLRAPVASPSGRTGPAMAFDPVHGVIVLFGGKTSTEEADTWVYDGATWAEVTPSGSPPARTVASMAWDSTRQRIVLFGGRYNNGGLNAARNDTWEWDGASWMQRTLSNSPSPRSNAAMTYDTKNARMVLYGGFANASSLVADTWVLTGSAWSPVNVTNGPPANRRMQYLLYDTTRDEVVLLTGTTLSTDPIETSVFDTSVAPGQWRQFQTSSSPPSRYLSGVAFDGLERRLVIFGGTNAGVSMTTLDETWSLAYGEIVRSEACSASIDTDSDALVGCADTDCGPVCSACGDGTCADIEDCRSCPADCATGTPACPIMCGDTHCDTGETSVNCPGDCP